MEKLINKGGGKERPNWAVILMVLGFNLAPLFALNGFAQADTATEADPFWLWQFLGRLHPLAVHFPVGLLLFAAVLELFTLKNFHSKYRPGINLLVLFGAIAAILAAVLGLLLANNEDYRGASRNLDQWAGLGPAIRGGVAMLLLLTVAPNRNAMQ